MVSKEISKLHIGPIANAILAVVATTGIVAVTVCAPNAFQLLKPFFKKRNILQNKQLHEILSHLCALVWSNTLTTRKVIQRLCLQIEVDGKQCSGNLWTYGMKNKNGMENGDWWYLTSRMKRRNFVLIFVVGCDCMDFTYSRRVCGYIHMRVMTL